HQCSIAGGALVSTVSATNTLAGGLTIGGAGGLAVTGAGALTVSSNSTSTFAAGINLTTGGCYAINGVCTTNQWSVNGSDIYYASGKVGVGTSTPFAQLSVNAPAGQAAFAIGSSTNNNGQLSQVLLVDSFGNLG